MHTYGGPREKEDTLVVERADKIWEFLETNDADDHRLQKTHEWLCEHTDVEHPHLIRYVLETEPFRLTVTYRYIE